MAFFSDISGRYQNFKCRVCGVSTFFNNYLQGRNEVTKERLPIPCFQCQECGNVQATSEYVHEHRWKHTEDRCIMCDGELRRDKVLFCPSCKGQKNAQDAIKSIVS